MRTPLSGHGNVWYRTVGYCFAVGIFRIVVKVSGLGYFCVQRRFGDIISNSGVREIVITNRDSGLVQRLLPPVAFLSQWIVTLAEEGIDNFRWYFRRRIVNKYFGFKRRLDVRVGRSHYVFFIRYFRIDVFGRWR